jgi:Icc-related predicted phosphoesterase
MAKLLVLSDMHGDRKAVEKAKEILKRDKIDGLVYLGDFSEKLHDVEANISDTRYLIKELRGLTKVHALFGNCDVPEVRKLLEDEGAAIHNKVILLGKTAVAGWGGSHPTPFNTPSEFSEEEIESSVGKLMSEARRRGAKQVILLTHEPPARTKADKLSFGHVGSGALRKVIETHQPDIQVCGHIHEAKSEDLVGKTRVINVGPARSGHFLEITVDDSSIKTREINL